MKVLLVSSQSVGLIGGVSSYLMGLLSALNREVGIGASIVCSDQIHILRKYAERLYSVRNTSRFYEARIASLKRVLKKTPKDVVVIANDVLSANACLECGLPYHLVVHGYLTDEAISDGKVRAHSRDERAMRKAEITAYAGALSIISVDKRIEGYIRSISKRSEITVMANFVNTKIFSPNSNERARMREALGVDSETLILVPRRLVLKNGVEYAIRAMSCVNGQFKMVVVGNGPLRSGLLALVNELGLQDVVMFLGEAKHEQIPSLLNAADICMVPSTHIAGVEEATSISAIEALSCGCPLLLSEVGGLKDIFEMTSARLPGLVFSFPDRDYMSAGSMIQKFAISPHQFNDREEINGIVNQLFGAKHYVEKMIKVLGLM